MKPRHHARPEHARERARTDVQTNPQGQTPFPPKLEMRPWRIQHQHPRQTDKTMMTTPSGPPCPGQTSRTGCPPNWVNSTRVLNTICKPLARYLEGVEQDGAVEQRRSQPGSQPQPVTCNSPGSYYADSAERPGVWRGTVAAHCRARGLPPHPPRPASNRHTARRLPGIQRADPAPLPRPHRIKARVRTAMKVQAKQGRFLGGRPPYGYLLAKDDTSVRGSKLLTGDRNPPSDPNNATTLTSGQRRGLRSLSRPQRGDRHR